MSEHPGTVERDGAVIQAILERHFAGRFVTHVPGLAWTVERGTSGAAVVLTDDEPESVVRITAPVVIDPPVTDALYRRVATQAADLYYGRFYVAEVMLEDYGPRIAVVVQENIPVSLLDPNFMAGLSYFGSMLTTVMGLSDRFDEEYTELFGGRPFTHDDFRLLLALG